MKGRRGQDGARTTKWAAGKRRHGCNKLLEWGLVDGWGSEDARDEEKVEEETRSGQADTQVQIGKWPVVGWGEGNKGAPSTDKRRGSIDG